MWSTPSNPPLRHPQNLMGGSSLGYEPKVVSNRGSSVHPNTFKILPGVLATLPDFGSEPSRREKFRKAVAQALMQLGAEFLIRNEKRENPDRGSLKTAMPQAALFSPRRQALEVGGGAAQQLPLTTPLFGYGSTQPAYAAEEAKYSGQSTAASYTYDPQGQPLSLAGKI